MSDGARRIGKFLQVRDLPPGPGAKTKRWALENVDGTPLGAIAWHSPWRCYVVAPVEGTIFHDACLRDIATFLTSVRGERVG